ncbi:MAG TPA: FAD-dependent oxidoreductase [Noviherbaspirillum sp.]|nr:FAD-dependent oxidoreductase [Noviherbaspirillum sp.]
MKPTIIIGSGLAGYTVAREVRKLDKNKPLLIVTADDGGFYSKPMLSNAYAHGKEAAQLVSQTAAQMASQLGASILTGTRVSGLDMAAATVATEAGSFEYEQLVLALGAQPIRLALNGDAAHEVVSVNTLTDYAALRARIAGAGARARVLILGAGLIGCEFADDLAGAGHIVTLVDPNPMPLASLAPPALSQGLAAALRQRGVDLQLGTTATRVERGADGYQVLLNDGQLYHADVVLSAVGLRPELSLAQAAGLNTRRGIVVDAYGRTSAQDVYALGDCAEYADGAGSVCLPYIAPLMTAARAIARTVAGTPTAIDMKAAPVIVKTPSYPLALLPPAAALRETGAWYTARDGERTICRFCDADGVVRGFGVAPQDAVSRQALMAEVGNAMALAA